MTGFVSFIETMYYNLNIIHVYSSDIHVGLDKLRAPGHQKTCIRQDLTL